MPASEATRVSMWLYAGIVFTARHGDGRAGSAMTVGVTKECEFHCPSLSSTDKSGL